MNVVIGIVIVLATVWFLLNGYEMRMVLIASGLLMAGIALDPLTVLDEFAKIMVTDSLIQAICSVMGFAFVMRETRCEQHLTRLVAGCLENRGVLLIPGVTMATFCINGVLLSAANTTAAMGAVVIPLMTAAGVTPAVAATAVLAGTFGSMLNPGLAINAIVGRIAGVPVQAVVDVHLLPVVVSVAVGAGCLTGVAVLLKETKGYSAEPPSLEGAVEKANLLFAMVPLVPTTILVLGASGLVPPLRMGVAQAMIVGALLGLVVTRTPPARITGRFFDGMGSAYGNIMGIVIAVAVFVRGMKSIGLISLFITWLTTTPGLAKTGGAVGPFLLGIISGSGDAAAFAFNEAVAPHALQYGMEPITMGSMAALAGALGRTMSPFAGAAIVCASIAQVNPMAVARRNAPGMCAAVIITYLII